MEEKLDEAALQRELDTLLEDLISYPDNITNLCRVANIYILQSKISRSYEYINRASSIFMASQLSTTQGLTVSTTKLNYWKALKNSTRNGARLNISKDRESILLDLTELLNILLKMRDMANGQLVSLQMAFAKESIGLFQDALAILSDLITAQASNVDLSYVIFKAAVLLKHMGQTRQALEYFEFVLEDPPESEGFSSVYVQAMMTLTYEQSGTKYKSFLAKAYKDLLEFYKDDMVAGVKRGSRGGRKMEDLSKSKNFALSSELWELLSFQALLKCEYVLASEFLKQALLKSPNKAKLLHLLAEVYCILKENDQAVLYAEKAMVLLPHSNELRNLLIQLSPGKWTDKLRSVPNTRGKQEAEEIAATERALSKSPERESRSPSPSRLNAATNLIRKVSGTFHKPLTPPQSEEAEEVQTPEQDSKPKEKSGPPQVRGTSGKKQKENSNFIESGKKKSPAEFETQINSKPAEDASKATLENAIEYNKKPIEHINKRPLDNIKTKPIDQNTKKTNTNVEYVTKNSIEKTNEIKKPVEHAPKQLPPVVPRTYVSKKPIKPVLDEEAAKILRLVLEGNENIHIYDPNLRVISEIRKPPKAPC